MEYIGKSNEIGYHEAAIDSILHLANYQAYFFGESHNTGFEPEFKFHFIRHLNKNYGVRHIFMEIGTATAIFFNEYLQSGDTSLLYNNQLLYLWGAYKTFWQKLFEYNDSRVSCILLDCGK